MAKRLGYAIVATLLGTSITLGACGDDPESTSPADGGAAGAPSSAGTKTGGSASGGSASRGGSAQGGATQGGESQAGASSMNQAGAVSVGGETPAGGTTGESGAASVGGLGGETAGAGGASSPGLDYACGSTTIVHKVCSALVAANCTTPTAVDCADCVTERGLDRAGFEDCPACLGAYDDFLQCGIDAYESNNLSAGIECFEIDVGVTAADMNDACGVRLQAALECDLHQASSSCPAAWPLP